MKGPLWRCSDRTKSSELFLVQILEPKKGAGQKAVMESEADELKSKLPCKLLHVKKPRDYIIRGGGGETLHQFSFLAYS